MKYLKECVCCIFALLMFDKRGRKEKPMSKNKVRNNDTKLKLKQRGTYD